MFAWGPARPITKHTKQCLKRQGIDFMRLRDEKFAGFKRNAKNSMQHSIQFSIILSAFLQVLLNLAMEKMKNYQSKTSVIPNKSAGTKCMYNDSVVFTLACPNILLTLYIETPFRISSVAKKCRMA